MKLAKVKTYNIHSTKNLENKVSFDKKKLGKILNIYGKMVALGKKAGLWNFYTKDFSIFSIYRHYSEHPIYKVKKMPMNFNKHEVYSVIAMDGKILKEKRFIFRFKTFRGKIIQNCKMTFFLS